MGEVQTVTQKKPPVSRNRKWSPKLAERVLKKVAETGSISLAAEAEGIHIQTVYYHQKRDPEFAAAYSEAMDAAFHNVLGHAFTRSMDAEKPSDRLTEVLLKFRWPERLSSFLSISEGGERTDGPANLDPRVIAKMDPADRTTLVTLLEKYLDAQDAIRSKA